MKTKFILFTLLLSIIFVGCDKYEGDTYDFSNSVSNYVVIVVKPKFPTPLAIAAEQKYPFLIQTRTPFDSDVTITCEIKGEDYTQSKEVVLPKGKIEVESFLPIPSSAAHNSKYVISMKSAISKNGTEVLLGRIKGKETALEVVVMGYVEFNSIDDVELSPSDVAQSVNFKLQTAMPFQGDVTITCIVEGKTYVKEQEFVLPAGKLFIDGALDIPPVPSTIEKDESFTISITSAILFKGIKDKEQEVQLGKYEENPKVDFNVIVKKPTP